MCDCLQVLPDPITRVIKKVCPKPAEEVVEPAVPAYGPAYPGGFEGSRGGQPYGLEEFEDPPPRIDMVDNTNNDWNTLAYMVGYSLGMRARSYQSLTGRAFRGRWTTGKRPSSVAATTRVIVRDNPARRGGAAMG